MISDQCFSVSDQTHFALEGGRNKKKCLLIQPSFFQVKSLKIGLKNNMIMKEMIHCNCHFSCKEQLLKMEIPTLYQL